MARRLRGGSLARTAGVRRLTAWSDGPGGIVNTAVSASATAFLGSFITGAVEGLTIVRIRGSMLYHLTAASAANDGFVGAMGIGIASVAAITAGVGSVPTPITEQDSENWLYWTPLQVQAMTATPGFSDEGSTWARVEIDTKAMRKLPTDLGIYAIIEVTEIGTSALSVQFDSRALAKLP